MPNIAAEFKKQTDKILRQQAINGTGATTIEGDTGGGSGPVINDPNKALAKHKTSGDHDGRYYTQTEINAFLAAVITRHEVAFTAEDPWTVTHNLGHLPSLTVWEETTALVGFGTQAFGTTAFGGSAQIYTVADPTVAVVTQQGLNESMVTWGSDKTGKVVYVG